MIENSSPAENEQSALLLSKARAKWPYADPVRRLPRITKAARAALHVLPVEPDVVLGVDGRVLAGLARHGLVTAQRLWGWDGRRMRLNSGKRVPRRIWFAHLTAAGMELRDYYDGRRCRRLIRSRRGTWPRGRPVGGSYAAG